MFVEFSSYESYFHLDTLNLVLIERNRKYWLLIQLQRENIFPRPLTTACHTVNIPVGKFLNLLFCISESQGDDLVLVWSMFPPCQRGEREREVARLAD